MNLKLHEFWKPSEGGESVFLSRKL